MTSLRDALAAGRPSEVTLDAVVLTKPHFFYGSTTHAMHEAFDAASDGIRFEVVDNVRLAPPVPVTPGDRVEIRGELIPKSSGRPLVHWTHHDPRHRHPDGYIELNGKAYA
jgi:hypothetical protein